MIEEYICPETHRVYEIDRTNQNNSPDPETKVTSEGKSIRFWVSFLTNKQLVEAFEYLQKN